MPRARIRPVSSVSRCQSRPASSSSRELSRQLRSTPDRGGPRRRASCHRASPRRSHRPVRAATSAWRCVRYRGASYPAHRRDSGHCPVRDRRTSRRRGGAPRAASALEVETAEVALVPTQLQALGVRSRISAACRRSCSRLSREWPSPSAPRASPSASPPWPRRTSASTRCAGSSSPRSSRRCRAARFWLRRAAWISSLRPIFRPRPRAQASQSSFSGSWLVAASWSRNCSNHSCSIAGSPFQARRASPWASSGPWATASRRR